MTSFEKLSRYIEKNDDTSIARFINRIASEDRDKFIEVILLNKQADNYFVYLDEDETNIDKELEGLLKVRTNCESAVVNRLKLAVFLSKYLNWRTTNRIDIALRNLWELDEYKRLNIEYYLRNRNSIIKEADIIKFKLSAEISKIDITRDTEMLEILEKLITCDVAKYQAKIRVLGCNYDLSRLWDLLFSYLYRYTLLTDMVQGRVILADKDIIKEVTSKIEGASIPIGQLAVELINKLQPINSGWI